MRFFRHRLCLLLVLAGLPGILPAGEEQEPPPDAAMPFTAGERLTYVLRWGVFNVGTAVMEVRGPVAREGVDAPLWHHTLTVRTNSAIDSLYKVRTTIESWTDLALARTRHYEKDQLEGDTDREIVVTFDWAGGEPRAHYTNYGRPETPCALHAGGTFDPLGATYKFRTLAAEPGTREQLYVTDGKKLVDASVRVGKRGLVRTALADFEAIKVNPSLGEVGGVFKKSPDATLDIWLSDDAYRIPVKVSSSVVVGSFSASLAKIEIDGEEVLPEGLATTEDMPVERYDFRRR